MNENIRLEDEELLFIGLNPATRIRELNEIGIFTVADLINADVTTLLQKGYSTKPDKNLFVVYQQILNYKYRGQKMIRDVYLNKEYHLLYNDEDIFKSLTDDSKNVKWEKVLNVKLVHDLRDLGFHRFLQRARSGSFLKSKQISMIDAIKRIAQLAPEFEPLSFFYVEYYEKEIKKSETEELDAQNVSFLKSELLRLLSQRNELDSKIAQLTEQVNALEGGSITNGRK